MYRGDIMDSSSNRKVFYDIKSLLSHAESNEGEFSLSINDNVLDFKFFPNESKNLLVIFQAAITRTKNTVLPTFSGMGAVGLVNANILMLTDPSLKLSDELRIAWYTGSQKFRVQPVLTEVLNSFSKRFGQNRTILFGASCGGFGALYYSQKIPNAYTVVANPQTNISRYHENLVKRYLSDCFPEIPKKLEIEDRIKMTEVDSEVCSTFVQSNNKLIYLQNSSDEHHVINHYEPFLKSNNLNHVQNNKVINRLSSRILTVNGKHWGKGHIAPPTNFMYGLLSMLANGIDSDSFEFEEKIEQLYEDTSILIEECILDKKSNSFISEIMLTDDVNPNDYKFKWSLYKDTVLVEKSKSTKLNKIKFSTPLEKGIYWVMGYAINQKGEKTQSLKSKRLKI